MTDVSFDTLGTLDKLKAEGFSDGQARALTERLQAASTLRQGEAATKVDIAELRTEIKTSEQRISDKVGEQFRWLAGLIIAATGVVIAAVRFL